MPSPLTVGVAGITGKFGRLIASKLLLHPNITVKGYARNPAKLPPSLTTSPRVQLFQGDAFDPSTLAPFVTGCDVVICAYLGDDKLMTSGQKILIDACEESGTVTRYVASDWSLDYTKLKLGELFPKDPMIKIKGYLDEKAAKGDRVRGVHVLIGGFMDAILSEFYGIWRPETKSLRFWGEGTEVWEGTSYENAAEFTAAVVADGEAVGVKRFLGDRKTLNEIVELFEKVYGFRPALERQGSLEELKGLMHKTRAENPADVFTYMRMFYQYYWLNGQTFVGPETDNAKYPEVKAETWEDFLRKRTPEELSQAMVALTQ
ncbi:hypothetical protein B0T21DRAFT_297463 [Apiosordaria backusii]|uniref:NAD(P)-binding domain-containing protein n=1 Tax=Apiosordaria backusii TaxID=314023 RepID=A0AA40AAC6_9PEZI|nr:hypothetical protein B0T21DRAFT_297463 [Apiosordaria backusii]